MSKLVDKQAAFFSDLCLLQQYAVSLGFVVTLGEVERTQYQQDEYFRTGASKKRHSSHQDRVAGDLHFYYTTPEEGVVCVDMLRGDVAKEKLRAVGEYWESLDPMNVWGGFFPEHYGTTFVDVPHFEKKL